MIAIQNIGDHDLNQVASSRFGHAGGGENDKDDLQEFPGQ